MLLSSTLAFEDQITGIGNFWYTPANYNDLFGQADLLAIQACPRGITGILPALTVQSEHSVDGQNWVNFSGTAEINGALIFNDLPVYGRTGNPLVPPLSFVRFKISLTGTSPQCYLKMYVTGRTLGGQ